EAQVARRDARLERELELAQAATLPPFAEQRADRRATGCDVHGADRSHGPARGPLPPGAWTRGASVGIFQRDNGRRRKDMDALNVAGRYLDTWNEADPDERAAAVGATWAETASYADPLAAADGRDEIYHLIGAVQTQAPGHVFRLLPDTVDAHHNVLRFG